jgi:hypothetical protein
MNLPSGLVFYLDFKYGTATNGRGDGTNLYGNVTEGSSKMGEDVDVSGGLYGAGQFGYTINQVEGSVASAAVTSALLKDVGFDASLTLGDYEVVQIPLSSIPNYDAEGIRAFTLANSGSVTLHKQFTKISGSNLVFVQSASGGVNDSDNVQVAYHKQPTDNTRGDFEADSTAAVDTSITIPEIDVKLQSEAIVAKTRKLKAQWTPEFAQDLNAYHSIDAEAELTSMLSEYISMEIDLEILDMLIKGAVTTEKWSAENNKQFLNGAWDTNSSDFYNTQGQWFQTLGTKMQKVSNKIHQKTLRGGANFAVVSPTVATILESIPGYAASTDGDRMDFAMGVQRVGSLNSRFQVYKNPYMTENIVLLGYQLSVRPLRSPFCLRQC